MIVWLVDRLLAWRWILLLAAVLLALGAWIASRQLEFDRSIENMFPGNSRVLRDYRQLRRVFAGNEIVLAVYQDPELFASSKSGIRRLAAIRRRIQPIPGVRAVLSIDQTPLGEGVVGDSTLAQRTRELFTGFTHGADARTVSIVCLLEPDEGASVPHRETIDQLRHVMQSLPDGLAAGRLTGEPALVVDGFRFVEQDGQRLGRWSAILLGLTIVLCFRSLRLGLGAHCRGATGTGDDARAAGRREPAAEHGQLDADGGSAGGGSCHGGARDCALPRVSCAKVVDRGEFASDRAIACGAGALGLPDRRGRLSVVDRLARRAGTGLRTDDGRWVADGVAECRAARARPGVVGIARQRSAFALG